MQTIRFFILVLVIGLYAAAPAEQTESTSPQNPKAYTDVHAALDAQVPGWLETYDVPSLALAYISSPDGNWTRVFGEQSPGVAATTNTLFNIASLTKPIVAETVLRLISAGELDLDESLAEHWIDPDVKDHEWHPLLTPEIALRHRTGFTNWRYETDDVLIFQWQPGTETGYSGEGFDYLVRAVERKMNQNFETLANERVFIPAGMSKTAFTPQPWFENRVAMVQGKDGSRRLPDTSEMLSAADNVHTTIGDYARFVESAMNAQGLSESIAEQRSSVVDNQVEQACPPGIIDSELCPERAGFGLGWQVFDNGRETVLLHTGKDWGERTIALFVPERRFGLVIFTSGANGMFVISEALSLLYDNPELNAQIAARAKFD